MKLDAIDLRILEAIQADGRITKLALAEKAGLSPTPCWMRLRKLEKAGIVTGYHARVALRRVAPVASVMMEITLGNHRQADFDRFERAIAAIPEIVACWSVGGGVDYILKIMTADIDAYQRLVDGLLERTRHRSIFHLHRHEDGQGRDRPAARLAVAASVGWAGLGDTGRSPGNGARDSQSLPPLPPLWSKSLPCPVRLDNLSPQRWHSSLNSRGEPL
ncbi:putative transcriptional regulator, AsnC family (plasmid) [Sinorhizobium medicae WSM419]|uniref:Putative transcriptional regulator, AsnC family n=2 Tax=Sinorhizobium TaxID=28105 RepID=A6UFT5_SINMW|nr:putative transcriptional regulator, AsnC family [Sinorhizobium medicae WSM419]